MLYVGNLRQMTVQNHEKKTNSQSERIIQEKKKILRHRMLTNLGVFNFYKYGCIYDKTNNGRIGSVFL